MLCIVCTLAWYPSVMQIVHHSMFVFAFDFPQTRAHLSKLIYYSLLLVANGNFRFEHIHIPAFHMFYFSFSFYYFLVFVRTIAIGRR